MDLEERQEIVGFCPKCGGSGQHPDEFGRSICGDCDGNGIPFLVTCECDDEIYLDTDDFHVCDNPKRRRYPTILCKTCAEDEYFHRGYCKGGRDVVGGLG